MMYQMIFTTIIGFYLLQFGDAFYNDSFDEELLVKPLANGHIYAYFQFTTLWHIPKEPELRESS